MGLLSLFMGFWACGVGPSGFFWGWGSLFKQRRITLGKTLRFLGTTTLKMFWNTLAHLSKKYPCICIDFIKLASTQSYAPISLLHTLRPMSNIVCVLCQKHGGAALLD